MIRPGELTYSLLVRQLMSSSPPRSVLASPRDSRAGSVESLGSGSMPGTPRKRVRYADEESLPLESFKDPSPE